VVVEEQRIDMALQGGSLTVTINYTETSSAPRISIDMTTLEGYALLADGTYDVQVVAKATGHPNSLPTTAIQYTKNTTTLISFTVDNVEYTAEENMTWQQFIDSEYNVDDFSVAGDEYVTTSHHHGVGIVGYVICGGVMISDEITANYNYVTYSLGQCP